MIQSIESLLAHHSFFSGMPEPIVHLIAGCGRNTQFEKDQMLFREGSSADTFYLIRDGLVSLEIVSPKKGTILIQTIPAGEVLGWSWLFPPYQWHFDARAVEPVRATVLDVQCLRKKCESDPALGYELMKRFAGLLVQRLQSTRLQLVDAYESDGGTKH